MPTGDCFRCHQQGHWANNCPNKPTTKPTVAAVDFAPSPPIILCPCNAGACDVLTSKTEKNPNRKFYKCSANPSCGFFKWCDQLNITKSESVPVLPTCPCGSGPCRRITCIVGPNAQRSYFVCCIKEGFGACGFSQWEDDVQIQPESEEVRSDGSPCHTLIRHSGFDCVDNVSLLQKTDSDSDGNVKRSGLGVMVESALSPTSSNKYESTLGNKLVNGIVVQSVKDYAAIPEKELIPVCSSFNNVKPVANDGFVSADGRDQVYEDVVSLETEEQVLIPSLMDLIEQFNLEKLHFESVSMKHVDVLRAFTSSSKKLESVRDREDSLRTELFEVEKQVKLYEAETSVCAASLEQVCGEMTKSQKKMVEMAVKVAKEMRVNKQMDIVEAQRS